MSYLITCSGSKQNPTEIYKSSIENLTFNDTLLLKRKLLISEIKLDLDWNRTLPAWQLYSGNRSVVYNRIETNNWTNPNSDIKILSALFGWISHTDRIPYYNIKMDDKVGGVRIHKFWKSTGLLDEITSENDISLLSGSYLKALNNSEVIIKTEPKITWKDRKGFHKGRWLNDELSKQI